MNAVLLVAILAAPPLGPRAQPGAVRLDRDSLAGLIWAATTDCSRAGDDLLQRQCRGLQAARAASLRQTYTIEADAGGITSDGALHGCLACAAPLDGRYVVSNGSVTVRDGVVIGPVLATLPVIPGARLMLSFSIPAKPITWTQGGKSGLFVDLTGYELVKPPASAPTSQPATLPSELSFAQISQAMALLEPAVHVCHQRYGVPGTAEVYLELASRGAVKYVEVRGDFADTPTGDCVRAAVKAAKFPPFSREFMRIHYSFSLR